MKKKHTRLNRPATRTGLTPSAPAEKSLLGAMLLAASLSSLAQTPDPTEPAPSAPAESTLKTVVIEGRDTVPAAKYSLRASDTTLGKGRQALRDIPQTLTVITEHLIDDRRLDDFREVLKTTAGVTFLAGETGEEDVRLRGFSLSQAGDVLRDGMREAQLITRDTFATDRVEVLKGSASMLFGKGSTGGVVNQMTKQPFLMDQSEASVTVGTGRMVRSQVDLNKRLDERSALRINAMVQDSDNRGARNDREGLAASWRTGIGERDEFQADLYLLHTNERPIYNQPQLLTGAAGDARRTIVPVLPAGNFYGLASDYLHSEQTALTLSHTHRFSHEEELKTTLRQGHYERDLWATVASFAPASSQPDGQAIGLTRLPDANTVLNRNSFRGRRGISDITQLQSDYSRKFEAAGLKHQLTAGVDLVVEDALRNPNNSGGALPSSAPASVRLTTVGNPNDGARRDDTRTWDYNSFGADSLGLYAQDVASLSETVKLVAGMRFDRFTARYRAAPRVANGVTVVDTGSIDENLWSPRIGALYQPSDTASYYVSAGESYNTSGDTYQFTLGNFASNSANGRMARTPPEKSRNYEIGGKWEVLNQRASVNAALFRAEKYNERNVDPDSAATQSLLSGKRHATGVEFSAVGRLTPKWELFYNHTWIPSARIDRYNGLNDNGQPVSSTTPVQGDRPGLTPEHSASAWSTYRLSSAWRVGLGANYRSSQTPLTNKVNTAQAFTVWDSLIEYTVNEHTSAKLNVTNLTNKNYADGLYTSFYTPGAPRRVMLTLKTVF